MKNMNEDILQDYVDARLDEALKPEVEAYLAANPGEAERLAAYGTQNQALHALYDPVLDEPVPETMRRPPGTPWRKTVFRWAAAVALILAGGIGGWSLRGIEENRTSAVAGLAEGAAAAYAVISPEVRHPVEVTAENEAHLVKWLSKRLGATLRTPDLLDLGFGLVGGRLLAGQKGPVALFVYEDRGGERLTVYVRRSESASGETAFRFAARDQIGVFYWIDGPLGYAIAGEVSRPRLLEVANAIYRQLNP
jgi:anti-sigma factor RsiW